jgi:flagellin-like hook-associated protein FlgL
MAVTISLSNAIRSNLLALQQTTDLANTTQDRLASGKKVNSALDNAVAFFQAKNLSERSADFADRKSGIDQGVSTLKAAVNGTEGVDRVLKQLKAILQSVKTATDAEKTSFQTQFNTLTKQLDLLANDASYQGLNLINATTSTLTVKFSNITTSQLDVVGKDFNATVLFTAGTAGNALVASLLVNGKDFSSLAASNAGSDGTTFTAIDDAIALVETAISTVRSGTAELAANVTFLQTRLDFTKEYIKTLDEGSGKLVLADINEEGANLISLQTRQQLALQALSFAAQSERAVLTLFR